MTLLMLRSGKKPGNIFSKHPYPNEDHITLVIGTLRILSSICIQAISLIEFTSGLVA